MWSSILDYAKLAICDGFARKAPEMKHAPRRKLRFDDSSPITLLERKGNKGVASQSSKGRAEEIARSVSLKSVARTGDSAKESIRDGAESVRSLGVSFWWQQDRTPVSQEKSMRETVIVSNELVSFLCGHARARKDTDDQKQTVLKTVEEACNVELELRPRLGGDKMQGLAITGTGNERDRAKTMIVRLASFCRIDTLSTVMDAWQDLSSPCFMHAFMSDCAEHDFGMLISPWSQGPENAGERVHNLQHLDMRSLRTKQTEEGWRCQLESLRGEMAPDIARFDDAAVSAAAEESDCDIDESSPTLALRDLSRYSERKFEQKLHYFVNHCGVRGS